MNKESVFYTLALTLIPGIGPVNAKSLISYCGSAENIFKAKKKDLLKAPGIGEFIYDAVKKCDTFTRAEKEIEFAEKNSISILQYFDDAYPRRLKNCIDSPVIIFYKGNANLNSDKVIGIVGTRKATEYGKIICEDIVEAFSKNSILVVSGLAYGIDVAAHKACVKKNVATVGVLGHGLDVIYPSMHKDIAKKMLDNGGLLTEFMSQTRPDRQNFPMRNRIVAGMIDALVVVETAQGGGAIITATLANSYYRDVFAFPGSVHNSYSKGCNYLIKTNGAALVENADDILEALNWKQQEGKKSSTQRMLFIELSAEEKIIYDLLKEHGEIGVDKLSQLTQFTPSTLASNLLSLEFQGIILTLPGKHYKLV